ncbi:sugar nucleotide-binding protein [Opitutales bacterium]|nr:sugar nucleotide-binding protein [Opitutales bacterium]
MFFILGATGYLGSYFVKYLRQEGEDVFGLSRTEIDYTDVGSLISILRRKKPKFLINAAGYTGKPNVDACESDKAECLFGNAVFPGRIRTACEEVGIPWGHVSSGCIYSDRKSNGEGWSENDEPNFSFRNGPCSFYSGTKALGEEILKDAKDCYIWRLRIPFNEEKSPRNYLQKLLNYSSLLEAENSISHIDDYINSCLSSFTQECEPGIYNLTNSGSIRTRQVVEWMKEEGVTDKEFNFFENEEDFMAKAAITPRSNCVMDTSKAERNGIALRPVEEAVRDSLRKMREQVLA